MIQIDQTILDFADELYRRLNIPAINNIISGKVYKDERPADSLLEDIVINAVTGDMEMIQRSVLNVNAHVPNLSNKMPNNARLKVITNVLSAILTEGYGTNFNYWIENANKFKEVESNSYFMNFRIRYKKHNTN